MARHVHDLIAIGHLRERRDVAEFNAIVETVPQPRQRSLHESDEGGGIVRSDFLSITPRLHNRLAPGDFLVAHLLSHRGSHGAGPEDSGDDRPPVRQVRADQGRA